MTDKVILSNLVNLTNQTTAVNTINANNAAITAGFDNTLSRDGTQPNTMGSNLDMNNNQILNLPPPSSNNSPLRLTDLSSFQGSGTVFTIPLPAIQGGTGNAGTAWLSWTPVLTAGAGSFTSYSSVGSFLAIGKTVFIRCFVTITNVGTASGAPTLSGLPINSNGSQVIFGRETGITGSMIQWFFSGSGGTLFTYNNVAPSIANGSSYLIQGVYESV